MKSFKAALLTGLFALSLGNAPVQAQTCYSCGKIQKIERMQQARSGKVGAVVGAVAGGAVGNQVGDGSGKKIATVAGAVAGAYAGKKIAEDSQKTVYKITVLMEDGRVRGFQQSSVKYLRVGDPVIIRNNKVKPRS